MSATLPSDSLASADVAVAKLLPMSSRPLLALMASWREQGWLRRLDIAFARFLVDLSPDVPDALVLAAALLVHMEGRGHSCLRLDELLRDPQDILGWPAEPAAALRAVLDTLPGDADAWIEAFRACPLVGADDGARGSATVDGHPPLMLRGHTLYLRRYWDDERRVAAQVDARSRTVLPVNAVAVRTWLDRLFPADVTAPASGEEAIDWQKTACAVALRSKLSILTGGPGTGKTYTAARLLALLYAVDPAPERMRVALAAPTGKAAARLKQSIETSLAELQDRLGDSLPLGALAAHIGAARTLHSLLGARPDTRAFGFDAAHPLEVDVVIVDEASMIHLEMMAALLEALPSQARVIFLGDKDQLASVEAGAVLGDLCRHAQQGRYRPSTAAYVEAASGQCIPTAFLGDGAPLAQQTVMLRASKRFGGAIGQLALAANRGDSAAAATLLRDNGSPAVVWLDAESASAAVQLALEGRGAVVGAADAAGAAGVYGGYGGYVAALQARPRGDDAPAHASWTHAVLRAFERFRVLCAVREGEWGAIGLNLAIERALVAEGRLTKAGEWYEGRPVIVTRNDAGLGVFNGDIGITLKPPARGAPLRAYFLDGDTVRSVAVSRLAHVETAFAMTVHKSQGSEFAHTVLVLPREPSRVLTRELVYTGITRAREAFTLVTGRTAAMADALAHPTQRASGLLERLEPGDARLSHSSREGPA
ncbi:DNA helicase/exodeoxyribonuclease V, alpha subunit [Variovorax sp. CF079]|uniref:exodeoxyribonuclease V subunit alpha n=1 Tax=Variovorax sp. CF079 TaxID=1882774 RepID=UPI000885F86D|nr:exodeoxyribonuclease V subunit alpha [Variovorax sp. CF079]SDC45347.1 DNA helicase/exodeoxyribonuclease V, alpha subunit [Variovorax sp. CF079]